MDQGRNRFLIGLDEISDYYGRSKTVVRDLIDNDNFPAVKVHGRWESSTELIDRYRTGKISSCMGEWQPWQKKEGKNG